jgi:sugar lactone lactonase YvrE
MNKTQSINQKQPLALAGLSRHHNVRSALALLTTTVMLTLFGHESKTSGQTVGSNLKPGDILYTDSGDAIAGGFILKLNPQSGQRSVLSQGGYLGFFGYPNSIALDGNRQIVVANEDCLLRIDPQSGDQTLIRDIRGSPGAFWGVAVDHQGNLLVAAEKAILRVNPLTSQTQVLSFGGYFTVVLSVAVSQRDGQVYATNARYVADVGWVGEIIRVNSQTGLQTLISQDRNLNFLLGITVNGKDIYVTGLKTHDENFGIGRVTQVDTATGHQRVVSEGGYLVRPVGIAVAGNGQLIVADPYTVNPDTYDFDGGVIRIDPQTGQQTLLAHGYGNIVNPCGLAIVP